MVSSEFHIKDVKVSTSKENPLPVVMSVAAHSSAFDAFSRLRVSAPHTLFDSKQLFDNQPLFWDDKEVSGSGTGSVWSQDKASSTMTVSASTAGRRIRQTFMSFNYQSGKSQLVIMTGTLSAVGGGIGIISAIGQYNDNNGIFFRNNEGAIQAVVRSHRTGSVVDDVKDQSDWNLDTLDGYGPSKLVLDKTKSQIIFIDYEWLSVGAVRVGFVIDGSVVYVHQFRSANRAVGCYMSTPNLPLRYEISNDGTGVASELEHICGTVISEGEAQSTGTTRYFSTDDTPIIATSTGVLYAVLGLRLKAGSIGSVVEIIKQAIQIQTASENIEIFLLHNPTVDGTFTYVNQDNSTLQKAVGSTSNVVSDSGTPIGGDYAISTSGGSGAGGSSALVNNSLRLGADIDGVLDTIVLAVRPIGGSSGVDVEGSLLVRELN